MAVIPTETWRRRLTAAMALRGQELKDFPEKLEGFPKNAARRAAHHSDEYVATTPLARSVAEMLDMPVDWFLTEDLGAWIRSAAQGSGSETGGLQEQLSRIEEALGALAAAQGETEVSPPSPQEHSPRTGSSEADPHNG